MHNSHLWFIANPRGKTWTEPEELVATKISGTWEHGPKDKENIVDGYDPLRKLYDCQKTWVRYHGKKEKFFDHVDKTDDRQSYQRTKELKLLII